MSRLNETQEIEAISISSYPLTFLQKIKKHYKKYAKYYNLSFGLLALALLVFSYKSKKK